MTIDLRVYSSYLDAIPDLPWSDQKRACAFISRFLKDPHYVGHQFHPLKELNDPRINTAHVSKNFKAVLFKDGETYHLLYVCRHDAAEEWAKRHNFRIHADSGAHILEITEEIADSPDGRQLIGKPKADLFTGYKNSQLIALGVAEDLIPFVRKASGIQQLFALAPLLSETTIWALEMLWSDEPHAIVQALYEEKITAQGETPTDGYANITPQTADTLLQQQLAATLPIWRVTLHPQHRELVEQNWNGPAKVLGGPGTGKTVFLLHRVAHLVRERFPEKTQKILVISPRPELVGYLKAGLKDLFKSLDLARPQRIEVTTLTDVALKTIQSQGDPEPQQATPEQILDCWEAAIQKTGVTRWKADFYQQEWNQVVRKQGIQSLHGNGETDRDGYYGCSRRGRGSGVRRADRPEIWRVFEAFRDELAAEDVVERLDIIEEARKILESTAPRYAAVLVDEAEDLHEEEWKLVRALAEPGPNDIFLTGDAFQRLTPGRVILSQCGIHIHKRTLKLTLNYRLTQQILEFCHSIHAGQAVDNLDNGTDERSDEASVLTGVPPLMLNSETQDAELDQLTQLLGRLIKEDGVQHEDICLVSFSSKSGLKRQYKPIFKELDIPAALLKADGSTSGKGVRLATVDAVKGMEFRCVILVGLTASPPPPADEDPVTRREREDRERSELFVAASRGREILVVSTLGEPSPYLPSMQRGNSSSNVADQTQSANMA